MRPVHQAVRLGRVGLLEVREHGQRRAGIDGDVAAAGGAQQGADHLGPAHGLARDGGHAEQVALLLREQVGERGAVVDVGADIGIEEDFFFVHAGCTPCLVFAPISVAHWGERCNTNSGPRVYLTDFAARKGQRAAPLPRGAQKTAPGGGNKAFASSPSLVYNREEGEKSRAFLKRRWI